MSVRTKLILIFLSLSVVPLAALTLLSYSNSIRSLTTLVERDNRAAADELEQRVSRLNEDLRQRVEEVTELPELRRLAMDPVLERDQAAQVAQAMQDRISERWSLFSDLEFVPAAAPAAPTPPPAALAATPPSPPAPEFEPPAEAAKPGELWSMKVFLPDFSAAEAEGGEGATPTVRQYNLDFVDGVPTEQTLKELSGSMVENMVRLPGFLLQTGDSGRRIRLRNLGSEIRQELMAAGALPKDESSSEALRATPAPISPDGPDLERRAEILRRFDQHAEETGQTIVLPVRRPEGVVGSVVARIRPERVLSQVFEGTAASADEVAFAVDPKGVIHARSAEDMRTLAEIGLAVPGADGGAAQAVSKDPAALARALKSPEWVSVVEENAETGYAFGVVRRVSSELQSIRRSALLNLFLGMTFIGLAGSGVIVFSRRMTHGLEALTEGARRIAEGDLDHRISARRKDELGQLARAFNEMAGDLEASRQRLVEQERVRRELDIARRIQRDSLPRQPFHNAEMEIIGRSIPSNEVGGDFFNYLPLPGGSIALLVGDVSGKGVPAALLMAEVQATLRTLLQYRQDVPQVMTQLNAELCRSQADNVYLTLFLGVLHPPSGRLTYVNAGHTPPFVLRAADGSVQELPASARPVGLFQEALMEAAEVSVGPGDLICVFTDGVAESCGEGNEEFFGVARVQEAVRRRAGGKLRDILDEVARALTAHHGDGALDDDATLLLARVAPRIGRHEQAVDSSRESTTAQA